MSIFQRVTFNYKKRVDICRLVENVSYMSYLVTTKMSEMKDCKGEQKVSTINKEGDKNIQAWNLRRFHVNLA